MIKRLSIISIIITLTEASAIAPIKAIITAAVVALYIVSTVILIAISVISDRYSYSISCR
jgi:hypothetical protein